MNRELPDVQAGFRKGRGSRDQLANIHWIIEKSREFQKNIYSCFIDYAKAFEVKAHLTSDSRMSVSKWVITPSWLSGSWRSFLWKILKEVGIPYHLTCFVRNLYSGQEATMRTVHVTTDWFQIGKGVCQGYILSPCLLNLHMEYIMWNAGLNEAQPGNKIAQRNNNNLKYADDTTFMAESKEELKSLFWKWKRRVKKLA